MNFNLKVFCTGNILCSLVGSIVFPKVVDYVASTSCIALCGVLCLQWTNGALLLCMSDTNKA